MIYGVPNENDYYCEWSVEDDAYVVRSKVTHIGYCHGDTETGAWDEFAAMVDAMKEEMQEA